MLKNILGNKKIVKIVKIGLLLVVICVGVIIVLHANGSISAHETNACTFQFVDMVQNAAEFTLK
ncbi:MAG: hypothetical protein ACRCTZ_20270 [Sarcina sp.]